MASPQPLDAPSAGTAHSRRRWGAGIAIGAFVAIVAYYVTLASATFQTWSYMALLIAAAIAAVIGARRSAHRRIVGLIAFGVVLTATGDVTWQALTWTAGEPDVSIADAAWIGSYLAIGAAVLRILRTGSRGRLDRDGWIDIGAVVTLAMVIQWQVSISALVGDDTVSPFVRFVWAIYPALDAVLLALVLRALIAHRVRGSLGVLVGAGTLCWLASDLGFTALAPSGQTAVWLDAGWMLGALLLATAAWQPEVRGAEDTTVADHELATGYGSLALGLLPLLLPGAIEVVTYIQGTDPSPYGLFLASVVLVGLAMARGVLLMRANDEVRARLASERQYAAALAANSSDAVAVVDERGRILNDATQLATLFGYPGERTQGLDIFMLVDPADVDAARAGLARVVFTPGQVLETELRVQHHDGRTLWLGVRQINLLHDPDVGGVVVNLHDITARKQAEQELAHQAFHDGLTGLANRALFADRVQQALQRASRTGLMPGVLFLDLDGFKTVNDSLGHGPGDDLLCQVARRISDSVRSGETVARLGGDEFAVLIEAGPRAVVNAQTAADRILQALTAPFEVADQQITVSASIGIAAGDPDATAASMLRDADVAMYKAKAAGKAQWVLHDTEMRTAVVERLQLETDLIRAIADQQFALVYQPVVELETERVVGFEALIRWNHPTLGVILPDRFIPIAEENGLIIPIGAWVLREACTTAARWHSAHPESVVSMAVNVSARQLASAELVAQVRAALEDSGLDPALLVVEMTETALVRDAAIAAERLHQLHDIGIRLAIDDFGTGYSSLSYLRQFPVDILKIDRSFVNSIPSRGQVPAIVRGLLDLGRTLHLQTIAEGVELDVQRDGLKDERCDMAQGYLFARPLDEADAEALLVRLDPASRPMVSPAPASLFADHG